MPGRSLGPKIRSLTGEGTQRGVGLGGGTGADPQGVLCSFTVQWGVLQPSALRTPFLDHTAPLAQTCGSRGSWGVDGAQPRSSAPVEGLWGRAEGRQARSPSGVQLTCASVHVLESVW